MIDYEKLKPILKGYKDGIRWLSRLYLKDVLLCIPQNIYSRTSYKEKPHKLGSFTR